LGRLGTSGFVTNDSNGDMYLYISNDGINFNGGVVDGSTEYTTLKYLEVYTLDGLNTHTIKLDAETGKTLPYRVQVI